NWWSVTRGVAPTTMFSLRCISPRGTPFRPPVQRSDLARVGPPTEVSKAAWSRDMQSGHPVRLALSAARAACYPPGRRGPVRPVQGGPPARRPRPPAAPDVSVAAAPARLPRHPPAEDRVHLAGGQPPPAPRAARPGGERGEVLQLLLPVAGSGLVPGPLP